MRFQCLVCLLFAGLAYGQVAPPAAPPAAGVKLEAAPGKAPEVKVGPDDPVITLKGFCADATLQGDACKTVITKAQFEQLAEALQPGMSPAMRRNLANGYSSLLRMSAAADKRGLDKGPTFDLLMSFARMQILSRQLTGVLKEESSKVSDADIEDYYKKNEASYEQATFVRIVIPRAKQIKPAVTAPKPDEKAASPTPTLPPTEEQRKAAEEAMTKLAADIRASLVKGEDPDTLEKEAYTAAGLPGNPPTTKVEKARRTALPGGHQAAMDLKVGEVSEVISDPNGSHYVYKLVIKETLPLETVKPEIQKAISGQRDRDAMQALQGNADLNEAYFGPAQTRRMPPRPGVQPPSDQPRADPD
jgi:bifunctional DNA-binding transcriptional regulator/antitoxin component of YhaV-PrlF toxin-antitoxin module